MSAVYLLLAAVSVALLSFLVIRLRLHVFVALLIVSFIAALVAGLGAMFGEMLRVTGGAGQIANRLTTSFGESRAQWALGISGCICERLEPEFTQTSRFPRRAR